MQENNRTKGRFIGVGVGPGDPELMTVKALKTLHACDRLILPAAERDKCAAFSILCDADEAFRKKELLCLSFPMIRDKDLLDAQMDMNFGQIREYLNAGEELAFITIGDPTVYSTFSYMLKKAQQEGYDTGIINGITSFTACAAALGIVLGEREEEIHILPGSYDVSDCDRYPGTRVYMKSGRNMKNLKAYLAAETDIADKSVYAVTRCGQANEQIYKGLSEIPDELDYMTVVIVKAD